MGLGAWHRPSLLTAAVLTGLGWACGSGGLASVPTGKHRHEPGQLVEVDYPPPPAKVEEIDPAPDPQCRWVDGYFTWVARGWEWIHGGWVRPPKGCYYAPQILMVWLSTDRGGVLYYGRPRWYPLSAQQPGKGLAACPDPKPCVKRTGQ
jgi:hypothetical protein